MLKNLHKSNTCVLLLHSFSAANSNRRGAEPLYQNSRVTVCSSSSSDETDSFRKPLPSHVERHQRKPEPRPAAREMMESQNETGYTTGDTGNELDRDHTDYLYRWATTLLPLDTAVLMCLSSERVLRQRQCFFSIKY